MCRPLRNDGRGCGHYFEHKIQPLLLSSHFKNFISVQVRFPPADLLSCESMTPPVFQRTHTAQGQLDLLVAIPQQIVVDFCKKGIDGHSGPGAIIAVLGDANSFQQLVQPILESLGINQFGPFPIF